MMYSKDEDSYHSEAISDSCYTSEEENYDENYDDGEFENSETSSHEKKNYTVLSETDIRQRESDNIDDISSVLSIPKTDASILLRHCRWSMKRVQEEWFSDEERVRNSAGLLLDGSVADPDACKIMRCSICYEKKRLQKFSSTACGHLFCLLCWKRYVSVSIDDGPGCLTLRCPAPKCRISVSQDMIDELVCSKDREKYNQFLIGSYVEGKEMIKWCPGPGCEYAIEFDGDGEGHDVLCSCGHAFCWNCTQDAHRPMDCDTVAQWIQKNAAESENTNWILAYTKPCPKCKRSIEKNEGCMHMTCGDPCKFEFCWLCLEPWSNHESNYECNRYKKAKQEGDLNEEDMRRDMARVSIDKYMHYYERWNANDLARKKAREDLHKVETESLEKLSQSLFEPITQLEFITKAWLQIVECRRVLKWTYPYGYYLPEKEAAKKQLFDCLQGEAEAGLERLHHCVEVELGGYLKDGDPSGDFKDFSIKLKGLTRVTGTYFENLVKALENRLSEADS